MDNKYLSELTRRAREIPRSESNRFSWGRVLYDPVVRELWFEVPEGARLRDRHNNEVNQHLVKINELLAEPKYIDVKGILTTPDFPYGSVLANVTKRVSDSIGPMSGLEKAIDVLNSVDFQQYLGHYAISRHISKSDSPKLIMGESNYGKRIELTNLFGRDTDDIDYVNSFTSGINGGEYKKLHIEQSCLYEGEFRDNRSKKYRKQVGKVDVVATLNYSE